KLAARRSMQTASCTRPAKSTTRCRWTDRPGTDDAHCVVDEVRAVADLRGPFGVVVAREGRSPRRRRTPRPPPLFRGERDRCGRRRVREVRPEVGGIAKTPADSKTAAPCFGGTRSLRSRRRAREVRPEVGGIAKTPADSKTAAPCFGGTRSLRSRRRAR